MSRFFASVGSSSDEDESRLFSGSDEESPLVRRKFLAESGSDSFSDDSEEESNEEEVVDEQELLKAKEMESRRSRFLIGADSESEDGDTQRVVKSQKDKSQEEISGITEIIGDAIDDDEWMTVSSEFDRLMRAAGKAVRFGQLPESFFDFVEFLGDVLNGKTPEHIKKLKADDARALNSLKHKYKKIDFEQYQAKQQFTSQSEVVDAPVNVVELEELTPATIPQRIQEILGSRGKRRVAERSENAAVLKRCLQAANTSELKAQVLVALLSTLLDVTGIFAAHQLAALLDSLAALSSTLKLLPSSNCASSLDESQILIANFAVNFGSFLQRCDDEFSIAMNTCDHHSPAYLELARVESCLIRQLIEAVDVLKRFGLDEFVLECQNRLLNRIYYRQGVSKLIKDLLMSLYATNQESFQVNALLAHCQILASKNRYSEARLLLIDSHLQENVHRYSPAAQIAYNRCLVHLGLAAFRIGLVQDAYFLLHEICSSGRPKELLGQGLPHHQHHHHQNAERAERIRLIPHHLHFNIELVDTVFSCASMLLELPQLAAQHAAIHQPNPRKIYQSRHLKRILDAHERSLFNGPPENSRETVVAATRALACGDWRRCLDLLEDGVKVWAGVGCAEEQMKRVLSEKIRQAALLLYLYILAPSLTCISVNHLSKLFQMKAEQVYACLSLHSALVACEDSSDSFKWREDRQLRRDHVERTISHLRELALSFYSNDPLACEYIVYGIGNIEQPSLNASPISAD